MVKVLHTWAKWYRHGQSCAHMDESCTHMDKAVHTWIKLYTHGQSYTHMNKAIHMGKAIQT